MANILNFHHTTIEASSNIGDNMQCIHITYMCMGHVKKKYILHYFHDTCTPRNTL